jgi:nitroreductase
MSEVESHFIPLNHSKHSEQEMLERSKSFLDEMDRRRSVRTFSPEPFSREILENIVMTASTAPSGAHKQPWSFCAITNKELKSRIRELAEKEEYENYHGRMSKEWVEDLQPFETNHVKEFIDVAPYIVIVFKQVYDLRPDGSKRNNYYVNESVGIAVGMFLAAAHHAGLVTLTHTPSPMNFLEKALERPANERAYLLIPVGFPANDTSVPDLHRKPLEKVVQEYK